MENEADAAVVKTTVDFIKTAHSGVRAESGVAVHFAGVSFAYDGLPVLEEADFHFHENEFVALVGPNGSGKTTILRLILGLAKPGSGTVTVLGRTPTAARADIGYVPQHAGYDPAFPISVAEVVKMGRLQGDRRADRRSTRTAAIEAETAMVMAGIADLADRPYSALSGGQRRRALVARALAARPRFLVLDEPTANMDAESEKRLYRTLGELKGRTTILVVTHDNGFVSALTDTVLCLGGRTGENGGCGIVRHRSIPAREAPPELFGGNALKVIHDIALPADDCRRPEAKT